MQEWRIMKAFVNDNDLIAVKKLNESSKGIT